MDHLPEALRVREVSWQYFGTLTYKSTAPSQRVRAHMFFAWLRELADETMTHAERILLCGRYERVADRHLHHHLLIGGLRQVPPKLSRRAEVAWKRHGGGFARFKRYDPSLDGVGYVLKALPQYGRSHRLMDDETDIPTLSDSLRAFLRRRSR